MRRKFVLLFLIFYALNLHGQVFTDLNSVGAPVSAMCGSGTSNIDNLWAVFINPAGLSRVEGFAIVSGYDRPYELSFLKHVVFSAGVNLGRKFGTLAFSFNSLHTKYQSVTLSGEYEYKISHAFYLQKDIHSSLAIGYSLSFYNIEYGRSAGYSGDGSDGIELGSGWAFGIDIGFQASLRQRTWAGIFIKNANSPQLGSALSNSFLPRAISIGVGYEPYPGLQTNLALVQPISKDEPEIKGGISYRIARWLVLRTGIDGSAEKVAFGAGIRKWNIDLDWALVTHPVLPMFYQVSIGFSKNK